MRHDAVAPAFFHIKGSTGFFQCADIAINCPDTAANLAASSVAVTRRLVCNWVTIAVKREMRFVSLLFTN